VFTPQIGAVDRQRLRGRTDQIAHELRDLILFGEVADGEFLGTEAELLIHFGVSRPCLREALRRLEGEGLVTVVLGAHGGVLAHTPDERTIERSVTAVLSTRRVALLDVLETRARLAAMVAGQVAMIRGRRTIVNRLRGLIPDASDELDPQEFHAANDQFERCLVVLGPSVSLSVIATTLQEVVSHAFTPAGIESTFRSVSARERVVESQGRLVQLLESGIAVEAELVWKRHLLSIGRALAKRS
jgi:GntR family transcriptional regulator, transcriptional repressor for pyruvate dehydrogenase complex